MADNKPTDYRWLIVVAIAIFWLWSCQSGGTIPSFGNLVGPCDDLTGAELKRCIDTYDL